MPGRREAEGDVNEHEANLAAAARGDDEALSLLVRTYHDRVYRFGLRVCRDGYDAEDAVQDAFTKLATRPDVARDPSALSWLFTVVRNACTRMLRPFARARRSLGERVEDADGTPSPALDPEASLERWRLVHAVHNAIATLERPYREVLVMRDLEGLSGPETCEALGLTEATMKTRLHRARLDMRRELEHAGVAPRGGVETDVASKSLTIHLVRGVIGIAAFALSAMLAPTSPLLSLALFPAALIALRGCPACWTLGLVQTVIAKVRGQSIATACIDGQCAVSGRSPSASR